MNESIPDNSNQASCLGPMHESSHSAKRIKEKEESSDLILFVAISREKNWQYKMITRYTIIYSNPPGSYTTHNAMQHLRTQEPSSLPTCKIVPTGQRLTITTSLL